MSTKLEAVVGLLAGREVEPGLLDELNDPSSEASRFLEATRARSRALIGGPGLAEHPGPSRGGRARWVATGALAVATLALLAGWLWVVDRRFRSLEAGLSARDLEARESTGRVEAILRTLAGPRPAPEGLAAVEATLGRIEADLARVDRGDPAPIRVVEELAALRRELAATEKAGARRAEELQAAIHDAARVVKLLLDRTQPPDLVPIPIPRPPHATKGENRMIKP